MFFIPALIWGSTWLVIKFQLGVVDPLISVSYRFFLAAMILLVYARLSKRNLKYKAKQHLFMMSLGVLLFGVNYWLVYLAELTLTSGLVAIVFSTIIFLNILFGTLFLKTPVNVKVVLSAIMGFTGVALVFKNELVNY